MIIRFETLYFVVGSSLMIGIKLPACYVRTLVNALSFVTMLQSVAVNSDVWDDCSDYAIITQIECYELRRSIAFTFDLSV